MRGHIALLTIAVVVTAIAASSLTYLGLQVALGGRAVEGGGHGQSITVTYTRHVTVVVREGAPLSEPSYTPPPERIIGGVTLVGAGASFPYPQIAQWVKLFKDVSGVDISYQSVGSGAGQRMFLVDRTVDFACSDPPLTRELWESYKGEVLQIPWLMGAVVVIYNVPESPRDHSLRLTPEVLAKVFKGEIERWDDPEIKGLNPEVAERLPSVPIVVVHRSDSSGTTEVFTTFLHKAAPDLWPKELVGKTIEWPVDRLGRGVGAKGNEGVTAAVLQTPYSIGYVEWSYAIENGLPVAAIRNAAGRFTLPTAEAIKAAAEGVQMPKSALEDFSHILQEVIYSGNEGSYPLASFTFILLWRAYADRAKALALSEFLKWIAIEGYKNLVPGYAAPPQSVVNMLLDAAELLAKNV